MQLSLFNPLDRKALLADLFQAYFDARKNKRNTINALRFEKHFESGLFGLYDEILSHSYEPKPSICFVVNKPVKREIFAADFRDRIIHHLIFNYISPVFEKEFINDCYSCRKGKGTHYGIKRLDHFIRSCSENYSKDCFILKLDIKGYFMAIDRKLLFHKVRNTLFENETKLGIELSLLLYLIEKVVFNDPTVHCIRKGSYSDWHGLPATKSMFHASAGKGLPIGNLTSQLFGNVYMNDFDHYVKKELGIKYYGRYVDDFVLIHQNKELLKAAIPEICNFLMNNLKLTLHPNKIYLQHFSKGVQFLGSVIKPNRIYISSRTKGNFYRAIQQQNAAIMQNQPDKPMTSGFLSSMNSYLGIMKHYRTYRLRKRIILKSLHAEWWKYAYIKGGFAKFVIKVALLSCLFKAFALDLKSLFHLNI